MSKLFGNRHKGYTLIEMLVSILILAIISSILIGLMTLSSKFYGNTSADLSVQSSFDSAAAQIRAYVINADIVYIDKVSENTLSVGKNGVRTDFTLDKGTLYVAITENGVSSGNKPLAKNCTKFESFADTKVISGDDGDTIFVTSFEVKLEFSRQGKHYGNSIIIALRNKPPLRIV